MTTIAVTVRGEGQKRYPMIIFPAAARVPVGWTRAEVPGTAPCFLYVRGTVSRRAALPAWNFPGVKIGDVLEVRLALVEPYRAQGLRAVFDWNAFLDPETLATDEPSGVLRVWNRYAAPFNLLRCPPIEALYYMLGFYQAEGSKGSTGNDFSFANSNPLLLARVITQLTAIGIGHEQLYAEILQGVGESREAAIAAYAALPLKVTAVRPRSGKGGHAYVVHAHNSKPFRGMVCRALQAVFTGEFPSKNAAKAYVFGWLDGDGSITLTDTDTKLRLAGLPEEHEVVKRALTQVFGWDLSRKSNMYKNGKAGSQIGLYATRMIDLLEAGAFPFSMNRVRLLLGFERRAQKLALGVRAGAFSRWGLTTTLGELTADGQRVVTAYWKYESAIKKAQRLKATAPFHFGVKCALLPNQFKVKEK